MRGTPNHHFFELKKNGDLGILHFRKHHIQPAQMGFDPSNMGFTNRWNLGYTLAWSILDSLLETSCSLVMVVLEI